jgi:hypothetical protein
MENQFKFIMKVVKKYKTNMMKYLQQIYKKNINYKAL